MTASRRERGSVGPARRREAQGAAAAGATRGSPVLITRVKSGWSKACGQTWGPPPCVRVCGDPGLSEMACLTMRSNAFDHLINRLTTRSPGIRADKGEGLMFARCCTACAMVWQHFARRTGLGLLANRWPPQLRLGGRTATVRGQPVTVSTG